MNELDQYENNQYYYYTQNNTGYYQLDKGKIVLWIIRYLFPHVLLLNNLLNNIMYALYYPCE